MKINFLIIACLISTLAAYDFSKILSEMSVGLGIEYTNGDKYIKLQTTGRFYGDMREFSFWVTINVKSQGEPETIYVRGTVT
jgi:hypothetical protein